jgi:K+-sensing histidine kinase KdpD
MTDHARIIVGVNHTPAAEAALRWALAKAANTGCAVTAVHVFDASERADLAMERDPDLEETETQRRAQTHVSAVVAETQTDVPVTFASARGDLESALTSAALKASALVVGQPQRACHEGLVHQLAVSASCPVVSVSESGQAITIGLPHRGARWSLNEAAELGV